MVAEALMDRGVLCKEAHSTTLRIAPPLVITQHDLDFGLDAIVDVLTGGTGGADHAHGRLTGRVSTSRRQPRT
jgi:acetylornithine/succinyldiaminopimelate/putrescine aminotransferase